MRRRGILVLVLFLAVSIQACSRSSDNLGHVPGSYVSRTEPITVGEEAYIELDDGAAIYIPADSVVEDILVTVERNPDKFDQLPPLPDGFKQLGDFYNYIVEGGSIVGPVQLSLPFDESKIPEGDGRLVIAIPTADGWVYKPVSSENGVVSWETLDVGDPVVGWHLNDDISFDFCDPVIDVWVTPFIGSETTEFLIEGVLRPISQDHWFFPDAEPELALDAIKNVWIYANLNPEVENGTNWDLTWTDNNGKFSFTFTPTKDTDFQFHSGVNIVEITAECEPWMESVPDSSWSQGAVSFIVEDEIIDTQQSTPESSLTPTLEDQPSEQPTAEETATVDQPSGGPTQSPEEGVPAQNADPNWEYLGKIPCSQMNNYDWYWNEAGSGEYLSDQLFNGYRPMIYLPDALSICPNFQLSTPTSVPTAIPTNTPSVWCVPDEDTACLYQYARDPNDPSVNVSGVHVTFRYDSTSGPVFFDGYTNSSGWVRFPVTVGRFYHFEFDYGAGLYCYNGLDSIGAGGEFAGCRYPSSPTGGSNCLKGCPVADTPTPIPTNTPTPIPTDPPASWCDPGTDTACMYLYARDPYDHSVGVPGVTVTYYYAGTTNVIYSGVTNSEGWVRFGTPIRPVYYDRVLTGWPDGSSCSSYNNSVTDPGYYTANFYPLNPGGAGGCGKP